MSLTPRANWKFNEIKTMLKIMKNKSLALGMGKSFYEELEIELKERKIDRNAEQIMNKIKALKQAYRKFQIQKDENPDAEPPFPPKIFCLIEQVLVNKNESNVDSQMIEAGPGNSIQDDDDDDEELEMNRTSRNIWEHQEMQVLLTIMKLKNSITRLLNSKYNCKKIVYNEIERELKRKGFDRNVEQIKCKIKSMKKSYRKFQIQKFENPDAEPPYSEEIFYLLEQVLEHNNEQSMDGEEIHDSSKYVTQDLDVLDETYQPPECDENQKETDLQILPKKSSSKKLILSRNTWEQHEMQTLLTIMSERDFFQRFLGTKTYDRNKLYNELEKKLKHKLIERTAAQIKMKLKNMKRLYLKFQAEKKYNPFVVPPFSDDILYLLRQVLVYKNQPIAALDGSENFDVFAETSQSVELVNNQFETESRDSLDDSLTLSKSKTEFHENEEICRTCLKCEDNLIPLCLQIDTNASTSRIIDCLNECFKINIDENDNLSQQICSECLVEVRQSHKFYLQMINAEKELKSRLTNVKSENKQYIAEIEVLDENLCDPRDLVNDVEVEIHEHSDSGNIIKVERYGSINQNKTSESKIQQENLQSSDHNTNLLCPHCKRQAVSYKVYFQHVKKCGDRKLKKHQCEICGALFNEPYKLRYHRMGHSNIRQFACKFCGKAFNRPDGLYRHLKLHTSRKFECHLCDKKFVVGNHLRIHLRKHENQRPFICQICSKGFMQKSHLKSHEESHETERKYECNQCDKTFYSKGVLRGHLRRVHAEKQYKCPYCNFETSQSYIFRRHLRQVHKSEEGNIHQYTEIQRIESSTKTEENYTLLQ